MKTKEIILIVGIIIAILVFFEAKIPLKGDYGTISEESAKKVYMPPIQGVYSTYATQTFITVGGVKYICETLPQNENKYFFITDSAGKTCYYNHDNVPSVVWQLFDTRLNPWSKVSVIPDTHSDTYINEADAFKYKTTECVSGLTPNSNDIYMGHIYLCNIQDTTNCQDYAGEAIASADYVTVAGTKYYDECESSGKLLEKICTETSPYHSAKVYYCTDYGFDKCITDGYSAKCVYETCTTSCTIGNYDTKCTTDGIDVIKCMPTTPDCWDELIWELCDYGCENGACKSSPTPTQITCYACISGVLDTKTVTDACPSGYSTIKPVCIVPTEGICCKPLVGGNVWDDEEPYSCGVFGTDITSQFPNEISCKAGTTLTGRFLPKLGSYQVYQDHIYENDYVDVRFKIYNEGDTGGSINIEAVILSRANAERIGYTIPGSFTTQAIFPSERVEKINPCAVGEEDFKEAAKVTIGPAESTSQPYGDVWITMRVPTPKSTSKLTDGTSNYATDGKYVLAFGHYSKCYDVADPTSGYIDGMEGVKTWGLWKNDIATNPITFYGIKVSNFCLRTDTQPSSADQCSDWSEVKVMVDPVIDEGKCCQLKLIGSRYWVKEGSCGIVYNDVTPTFSTEAACTGQIPPTPICSTGQKFCDKEQKCIAEADWTEARCTAITPTPGKKPFLTYAELKKYSFQYKVYSTFYTVALWDALADSASYVCQKNEQCENENCVIASSSERNKIQHEVYDALLTELPFLDRALHSEQVQKYGLCLEEKAGEFDILGWIKDTFGVESDIAAIGIIFGGIIVIIFLLNMLLTPKR